MQFHYSRQVITILTVLLAMSSPNVITQTRYSYADNNWPDIRYTDSADGTVLDNVTNLIWHRCYLGLSGTACETGSVTLMTWEQALQAAEANTLAGANDWRLPNLKELYSLLAFDRSPMLNQTIFPGEAQPTWTSTIISRAGSSNAWLIRASGTNSGFEARRTYR